MMHKPVANTSPDRLGFADALVGIAGLMWELLALRFPRLRESQLILARSTNLDGVWQSEPRDTALPMKRRRQFVRIDALDGREKFGFHPEGEALRQLCVEGVRADGDLVKLQWYGGTNTWSDFALPSELRDVRLGAIRITSALGVPVRVRWMCDEGLIK